MGNQKKHYYLKLEDFKILSMFGECEIDVTNSKVQIKLDKNENLWWKKLKFKNKRKSETLTTDDIILYCETKDFLNSSYVKVAVNLKQLAILDDISQ